MILTLLILIGAAILFFTIRYVYRITTNEPVHKQGDVADVMIEEAKEKYIDGLIEMDEFEERVRYAERFRGLPQGRGGLKP
jgi:uncharacterized membrane protein